MQGVIWITGLCAAGKSTLAAEVLNCLRRNGHHNSILIDGDAIRSAIADTNTGYDRASRLRNAYRICRIVQLLNQQQQLVVTATISLFHEIHAWNRQHFSPYEEIWLQADTPQLQTRLMQKQAIHSDHQQPHPYVGTGIPAEFPLYADQVIANNQTLAHIPELAEQLVQQFMQRHYPDIQF